MIPLSAYFSTPPVMVKVFPEPVCSIIITMVLTMDPLILPPWELNEVS